MTLKKKLESEQGWSSKRGEYSVPKPEMLSKSQPRQFRAAGPMVLPKYTWTELTKLREAVGAKDSKVKYVALCKRSDETLLVFAKSSEKLSVKAWHRWCRVFPLM